MTYVDGSYTPLFFFFFTNQSNGGNLKHSGTVFSKVNMKMSRPCNNINICS